MQTPPKIWTPGQYVGARRWPMHGSHPDAWGRPWMGLTLDIADPRAWADTLAFAFRRPTPENIAQHIARHADHSPHWGTTHVPVLWDFGTDGPATFWERAEALAPYADDLTQWEREREEARARPTFSPRRLRLVS